MKLIQYLMAILLIATFTSCSKSYYHISDALPKNMKTKACDVDNGNFVNYIYTFNDQKVLLLHREDKKFMYFTETLAPGQSAESWYEAFYRVKAEEAGESGVSGLTYFYAQGEPTVRPDEGATYFLKMQDVEGKSEKIELDGLVCALSEDETQLAFAAVNNMVPKPELVKNIKIFNRAFGGKDRKILEDKIIKEVSKSVQKQKQGSRVERAKRNHE
jgi:hypothetical protein